MTILRFLVTILVSFYVTFQIRGIACSRFPFETNVLQEPQNLTLWQHQHCPKTIMDNPPCHSKTSSGSFSDIWSTVQKGIDSVVQNVASSLPHSVYSRMQSLKAGAIPAGPYHDPPTVEGRTVVVHLFEWKWTSIAQECEQFLGPNGFAAVQISQPGEHSILWQPSFNREVKRPWYERYRPVSYKLITRSGTEGEFADMVKRCNAVGVRIYVDVVLNHMSHHLDKQQSTGGSPFDAKQMNYEVVPYRLEHFNSRTKCGTKSGDIENFQDIKQMRNCRLLGLNDLDQSQEYVQNKMTDYLNHMIDIGVGGFRVDAAKHIWPKDLQSIYSSLKDLSPKYFPLGKRPFIYQEVSDIGLDPISSTEYVGLGRVTEFHYGGFIGDILRKTYPEPLASLKTFGESWGQVPSHHAFVFIDNHDTQRGHGVGEHYDVLTFFEPRLYKIAVAFMLSWPYGISRVMSSYRWVRNRQGLKDKNDWWGPPHDDNWNILDVKIGSDGQCKGGWVCEHRWKEIVGMVGFRNVAGNFPVTNWWDNSKHQIAFSRGHAAFIAINNDDMDLNQDLQTGLPEGNYRNVISHTCEGNIVHVNSQGMARITIPYASHVPIFAIHIKVILGGD